MMNVKLACWSDDVSELKRRLESGADTDDGRATVEEQVERKQLQEEISVERRQTVRQPGPRNTRTPDTDGLFRAYFPTTGSVLYRWNCFSKIARKKRTKTGIPADLLTLSWTQDRIRRGWTIASIFYTRSLLKTTPTVCREK